MNKKYIGFLHPGAMGISLAATAQNTGHIAYWVSQGRSPDTYERAAKQSLVETQTIQELCDTCSVIISICPPQAATEVAEQVLACSFTGIYADANAISPQRAKRIAQLMNAAGVEFVDGSIIGGPAWKPDTTWFYLSGPAADHVAVCFSGGPLATEVIGDNIGKASALKMCYAANTKATSALLGATVAAAEEMGVRNELEKHWSRQDSDYTQNTHARITRVTAKAWRFSGEMEEIATTFENAGLPNGFHLAAREIYQRLAKFKGADPLPSVEDVLNTLLNPGKS
ncbi:MAG: NAD(P)-dependent oxidoreductase [Chloroflexi bacterium]|nr:NAD(P)-dependent oxidoreductase [Chloroflexota bacterium]